MAEVDKTLLQADGAEGDREKPKPSAPVVYLLAAFIGYLVSFSYAVAALASDLAGDHNKAARLCASPFFGPLGALMYLVEIIIAKTLGWVSWYGRPPKQILRHHSAFLLVMGGFCWMWLVERPKVSEWFEEHWPFRIWLITAGLTNLNETFIVFQNFMYLYGMDPITKSKVFYQRCLALFVMVQALILGLPSGAYVLIVVLPPAWANPSADSFPVYLFSFGVASQFLGQLCIQLPDCGKLIDKLRGKS